MVKVGLGGAVKDTAGTDNDTFFLTERSLHLKNLAAIAEITQNPDFEKNWFAAKSEEELKHIVILAERRGG